MSQSSTRNFGLDLFRAIAIILVVLGHGGFLLNGTRFDNFPFFKMIDGVDMFFVLSGFLIGGILLRENSGRARISLKYLGQFWKRRWYRTLPNYYLVLFLNFVVVRFTIIHEDIQQFSWKFLFFLHNFHSPFYGFFWESWSLSIEEWFYIAFPILFILLTRFLSLKRAFLVGCLLLMAFPIFYRWAIINPNLDDFWFEVSFRKLVLTRLDSIAFGLLAAWIFYFYQDFWNRYKVPSFLLGIALIGFVLNFKAPNNGPYKQLIYLSLSPLAAMLLLPLSHQLKTAHGFVAKSVTHISKISYSMYLINLALIAEVMRDNFAPQSELDGVLKYLLYWFIVILASSVLYRYFEKPVMDLRDRGR